MITVEVGVDANSKAIQDANSRVIHDYQPRYPAHPIPIFVVQSSVINTKPARSNVRRTLNHLPVSPKYQLHKREPKKQDFLITIVKYISTTNPTYPIHPPSLLTIPSAYYTPPHRTPPPPRHPTTTTTSSKQRKKNKKLISVTGN
jgi:hypothetical protein